MHFLVLNGSEQKCARTRAFCEKYDFFDSKSILTSLIALEHLSWYSRKKYALKKFTPKALNVCARAINENIFEYLFAKFGLSQNKSIMRYIKL